MGSALKRQLRGIFWRSSTRRRLAALVAGLLSTRPVVTDVEISSTARSRLWTSLHRAAVLAGPVVTVLLCTVLPAALPAGADPVGSARAQAAQVTAQLQADQAKLDALDQSYELAQQKLSSIQAQVSQVRDAITQDQAQVQADLTTVRNEALQSYETGAGDAGLSSVFVPGGEEAAVTKEYSTLAVSAITSAVDQLRSAQNRLTSQQSQLQAGQEAAQATADQIAAARATAQATTAQEESTLHSISGEIANLVAAQQAAQRANLVGAGFANPPANGAGAVAVRAAESQIGAPYQWGAEDPGHGFDCSGLTQWAWGQAGVHIPRTADDQYLSTARVPLADMEPGDLVFWGSGGYAEHVGIYVGNGDVVHAPSSGQDVQVQPIWSNGLMGAGRP